MSAGPTPGRGDTAAPPASVERVVVERVVACAREAGQLLRALQNLPRTTEEKSPQNLVTDADQAAEALIVARLSDDFPGARFLLEEGGEQEAPGRGHEALRFIVDPLDGTTNFASQIPHFAVSIAAEERGTLVAGAVYDPWRDEMFWAQRGGGAFLVDPSAPAGRRLRVTETPRLADTVVATGFPYSRYERDDDDDNGPEFCALNLTTRGCRRNGAATLDLAWVAAGRFDAFWERGLKAWDVAAGALLVEEAGGTLTNYGGRPCDVMVGEVVASNGHVHDALLRVLARARALGAVHAR